MLSAECLKLSELLQRQGLPKKPNTANGDRTKSAREFELLVGDIKLPGEAQRAVSPRPALPTSVLSQRCLRNRSTTIEEEVVVVRLNDLCCIFVEFGSFVEMKFYAVIGSKGVAAFKCTSYLTLHFCWDERDRCLSTTVCP